MRRLSVLRSLVLSSLLLVLAMPAVRRVAASGVVQTPDARGVVVFRVIGESGQPVVDIRAEEVSLLLDGRTISLRSLDLVDGAGEQTGQSPAPAPFATNSDAPGGRQVALLLDDESIDAGRERSFRGAVQHLLEGLSPDDRVSFQTVRDAESGVPWTRLHESVMAKVAATRGRARTTETIDDVSCRTRMVLQALEASLRSIAGSVPTTLVFFSTSLLAPNDAPTPVGGDRGSAVCEVRLEDFNKVVAAARAAAVDFYVVDVVDGVAVGPTMTKQAGLQSLAGSTGADLIRITGDNQSGIGQIARETTAFYRATFDLPPSNTRSNHRIDVRVSRKNVKVRAQRTLALDDRLSEVAATAPATRDMLRMARIYRDLPLRVVAFASRGSSDNRVKVTVAFEPADDTARLKSAAIGLFDDKGKLAAQWTGQSTDLARRPAVAALGAPIGAYRLRVAASDERGLGGTVDDEIWVGLTNAGTVKLSGLALGTARSGSLAPALQFHSESAAVGYLEIYNVPKTAEVAVGLEVATAANLSPLGSVPAKVNTASDDDSVRLVLGVIPLAALPPGDYIVRAVVTLEGQSVGRVARTLRKN
jgi:hypothetical protein